MKNKTELESFLRILNIGIIMIICYISALIFSPIFDNLGISLGLELFVLIIYVVSLVGLSWFIIRLYVDRRSDLE